MDGHTEGMGVSLQPVTMANLKAVYRLRVAPEQESLVAPVGYSIAQAHLSDDVFTYRAIYHDDTPVGFMMWDIQPPGSDFPGWGLSRLLIDQDHQGRGYGTASLDVLCELIRARSDVPQALWTSYDPAPDGARGFYLRYGFEPTGDIIDDDEEVALLRRWPDGTPTADPNSFR